VLAALLATVGLYGVISDIVSMRQKEIGIRMALGAQRSEVIGLVMRQAGWMLVTGVVIGIGLTLLAGSSVSSLLFGVEPYDLPTLAGAMVLLTVIAACASFVPARRAAGLDPMIALRHE
jgi:ABC-type antimicrobial peptide transport system permease subunit